MTITALDWNNKIGTIPQQLCYRIKLIGVTGQLTIKNTFGASISNLSARFHLEVDPT